MAAVLESVAGKPKERDYIREARRVGMRLLDADVNISGVSWTIDTNRQNTIRKGLASIPGIGTKSAIAIATENDLNGSYESIEDMVARLPGRALTGGKDYLKTGHFKGSLEALRQAGALSSLGHYRDDD
jgi:DNA polymerase III alpha subunit